MIVAGIGSRKGVGVEDVLAAIETALEAHGLAMTALSALATTEFKRNEEAIFAAGRELNLPVIVVDIAGSEPSLPLTQPPLRSADLSPRGEEIASGAASLFSPTGVRRTGEASDSPRHRWPEGPDEGAASRNLGTPSVSEASALAVAGTGAKLLGPRIVLGPVTCAIAISGDAP
ncbi:cobalamin biosynthesis protein [Mesorhizobium carmichaelinearum]|uniref:cobalamin biosynthesis protein n=1 Tax=Mesorhizobium carmichaelinearum TaxID=1208188 RepID=UPI001FCE596C|nr:cobalamin biosynthesis protein [Mesorhizobium carmichaelinearum]